MPVTDITQTIVQAEAPRNTDLSREVLTMIFGDHWWNLTEAGLQGQGIFDLLRTLNAGCAVVIAWLMILTLFISSTGAAQEGRVFGGRYFTPWVPIRFAFAIAAVTPVQHGLCAMQIMLLSCVGVSVNLANVMYDTALEWLKDRGSLSSINMARQGEDYALVRGTLDVGDAVTGASRMSGKTLAVQILQTEAFLTYLNTQLGCSAPKERFAEQLTATEDPATGDITLLFVPDGVIRCERGYIRKTPEVFGGFIVNRTLENDVVSTVDMQERVRLLKELVTSVEQTGAPAHFSRMQFDGNGRESITVLEDRTRVQAEGAQYAARLSALVQGRGTRREELQNRLDAFVSGARSLGWFGLGSHYWSLATLEQELQAADDVTVSWLEPRFTSFTDVLPASFVTSFWPRINEASYLGDAPSDSLWDKLLDYLSPFTGLTTRFAYALEGSPDALLSMVSLARFCSGTCTTVLMAAETAKLAAIGGSKIVTKNVVSRTADFFTGAGEAGDTVLRALVEDLGFFLYIILLPLWTFSTFVAYLVPAIPFLIWIAAIAGWVVITMEAVIAAPLWLIGHAMPEGEGFAGTHGRSGYMLFLSVLLRPCLLVLSMFVCFLVMHATGSIIGSLCQPFIEAEASLSAVTLGIVGCIFLFIIICGAITLLTWKLFELVTQMPDRIIRWIGQQIATLGNESRTALEMTTFRQGEQHGRQVGHAGTRSAGRGISGWKMP